MNRLVWIGLYILCSWNLSAATDKYRLSLRDDPSTTITIGWNQISGDRPIIYYGQNDHGADWKLYKDSVQVSRSVVFKGMRNQFVRLRNLKPNTAYFFVIKDEEDISRRLWFKTAPNDRSHRLSLIAGGDSRNYRGPRQNANKLVAKLRPNAVLFGDCWNSNRLVAIRFD